MTGGRYLSEHLMSACARLGISVQPARVYQATDKAALERFFRTLREQLLAALPGYKGPDVYRRERTRSSRRSTSCTSWSRSSASATPTASALATCTRSSAPGSPPAPSPPGSPPPPIRS